MIKCADKIDKNNDTTYSVILWDDIILKMQGILRILQNLKNIYP